MTNEPMSERIRKPEGKKLVNYKLMTQGQEAEFHVDIEIQLFHEVEFSIMRSKLTFFMRSNFFAKLIRRSNRP